MQNKQTVYLMNNLLNLFRLFNKCEKLNSNIIKIKWNA